MKLKKVISLGLAAVLCLSMFAGCGDKPAQNQGEQGGTTSTPTPDVGNNGDTDEEVRFVENIYNMGGKTIKIHDCWLWKFLNDDPSTWSRWESQAAAVIDQIEKDYNVTIEVLNDIYNLNQNITTGAASGEVYANIIAANDDWNGFVDAGYAADVTTIKNLGIGTNDWEDMGDYAFNTQGKQVGVDFCVEDSGIGMTVMCFNKDLAEQYEIEDIYELVRNNEWTFDKFEEICQDITKKSNGSVKGLLTPGDTTDFLTIFSLANDADYVIYEDGKYVYNGLSEEIVTGYEFAQNLVKNGLFDIETLQSSSYPTIGDRTQAFGREHKTLFFMCSYSWIIEEVDYRLEDYGIVPMPMGPDADEYKGITVTQGGYYFTEGDPDIEDAAAILVAIANRLSLTKEELLEKHFDRGYIRDEESLEFMKTLVEKQTFEREYKKYFPIEAETAIRNLDSTPRQVLEQTAQKQQALIDEALNK